MLLLLVAPSWAASSTELSFSPWSGASIDVSQSGTALGGALSVPLGIGGRQAWTLGADASLPAAVLSSSADGTYEVSLSLATNNARRLSLAVEDQIFGAAVEDGLQALDGVGIGQAQSIWCDIFNDKKGTAWSTDAVIAELAASDEDARTAWIKRVDTLVEAYAAAPDAPAGHNGSCQLLDEPDRLLGEARVILVDAAELLAEEATMKNDIAASPLNQLAKRELSRTLWRFGPELGYTWDVATDEATDVAALDTHGADAGVGFALYFPAGVGLAVGGGGSADWTPSDGATPELGAYAQAGVVWTSRATLKLPGLGGSSKSTSSKSKASATSTITGSDDEEEEADKEEEGSVVAPNASHYIALELTAREDFGASGVSGAVQLAGALRPTEGGYGISLGARLDHSPSGVEVLPTISIAGELPDLLADD